VRLSWPLVGRSGEMQRIKAAVAAPDTCGVVVWGAAGVGKSRIAREAVSAVASRATATRWTAGTSSGQAIPLSAFTAWAPSDAIEPVQLLRAVIESVTSAPAGTAVVVAVDDAHLLDELSTFVLHQIAHRGTAKLILTVCDGEPISAALQEIWRSGRFERLDLQPLSPAEVGTLLSAALGGPVDPDAAERFWRLTEGNALYLRTIVEQEVADGRLAEDAGRWRWLGDPVIPPDLIGLLEARIGLLPAPVGDVVDVLAVAEPLALSTLRRIVDSSAIEEADNRGLIALDPVADGVEVRVAHPLYGEVRRRRVASTRLRRLRGLVATELAASGDSADVRVIVRRASLSLDSDLAPDVDLLVQAARGAVWLADLTLAERLAQAAIRTGAGPEPSFVRAHALSWLGRGKEADAVFTEVSLDELTDGERARFAFLRASNFLWALADPARAKQVIDAAAAVTPPQARTYIDAFLAVYWFAVDRPDEAVKAADSLAVEALPPVVGAEIAWVLATIAADAGQVTQASAIAEAGFAAATSSLDAPHMRFNIVDAHSSALLLAGRIADGLDAADGVRTQAADLPGAAQLLGRAVAGRAALGAGRLDTACSLLEQATIGFAAAGYALGWGYRYSVPYATALAMRGSTDAAADVLAALENSDRTFRSLDYERSLARAWVVAGQGAVSEAIGIALAASERAQASGRFAAEVLCLQTAVQFGDHSAAARLLELERMVEGPRAGLAARFAAAVRDRDAAQLSILSEEFEQIGDDVAAADAAAQAATIYRRQDLRGSAFGCSARADALAKSCGGASTPAIRRAADPLPLTDREREIVMLIGTGLSSRDIAKRLSVSKRTIESHVYRAMAKTGTTSREQLAALIRPSRPKG
jgi:DNA-binding CsgD family transcriptional regulator